MTRTYQITLMNWLTRTKKTFTLGETKSKATEQLKFLRKKHGRLLWVKTTPIHC